MNAGRLYRKDGSETNAWFCEACSIVHQNEFLADICCSPRDCTDCGKPVDRKYYTICTACQAAKDQARLMERFAKAEKIPVHGDHIFDDGGCELYADIQAFLDHCDDCGIEPPDYVWDAKALPVVPNSAELVDDIVDRICENAYEGFEPDQLAGMLEMKHALNVFVKANQRVVYFEPDYTRAMVIKDLPEVLELKARLQAELEETE